MRRMRRRLVLRFGLAWLALAALAAACGARTGLGTPPPFADASTDATVDAHDAPGEHAGDAPLVEGGPLDVMPDCSEPAYCVAGDPGYVYKCGIRIYQCSSLEQCEKPCADAGACDAKCVNPCVDTLGQDTSNGCEFYAVEMDTTPTVAGVCYAVFVVNQWKTGEPARLQVDLAGNLLPIDQFARIPSGTGTGITYGPFDPSQGLAKDQIAILFLSRDPNALNDPNGTDPRVLASCPPGVTPAVSGDAALHGTGTGMAFHLKSNVPVVAYQMLPYGGGSARVTGATLLLPTNVWGDNYLAANAYSAPTSFLEDRAGPTLAVIAQQDNTHVTIDPVVDLMAGGGLGGTSAGVPITYVVNKGQYLQFTQPSELTGSPIQSDAPVVVLGSSTLMDLPLNRRRADSAEQMLPPVQALGSEYVAVRYRSRDPAGEESVPWRIIGAVDGTRLAYDPPQPGAPTAVNARQLAELDAPGPFVVSSQDASHPFYMAQYMTGGEPYDGTGDPEFVNVISPSQYLSRYTFFTDPTYPETNLVIVRVFRPFMNSFPDVTLECAGTLGGWQPVGASGKYQFTRVDLSTGNFQGQNGCDNGVHTIEARVPAGPAAQIGVTIWGWGNPVTWPPNDETNPKFTRWVSYGYPAGANITKLNDVVVPAR
jgi:hypothetical protein